MEITMKSIPARISQKTGYPNSGKAGPGIKGRIAATKTNKIAIKKKTHATSGLKTLIESRNFTIGRISWLKAKSRAIVAIADPIEKYILLGDEGS
jgi:hypothetical protein